jgi:hypothetical protein
MADRPVSVEEVETQDVEVTPEVLEAVALRLGEWFGPQCEGNLTMAGLRVIAADVVDLLSQRTSRPSDTGQ